MLVNGLLIILMLLIGQVGISSKLRVSTILEDLEMFRILDFYPLICIDRWIYPRIGRFKCKDNNIW